MEFSHTGCRFRGGLTVPPSCGHQEALLGFLVRVSNIIVMVFALAHNIAHLGLRVIDRLFETWVVHDGGCRHGAGPTSVIVHAAW